MWYMWYIYVCERLEKLLFFSFCWQKEKKSSQKMPGEVFSWMILIKKQETVSIPKPTLVVIAGHTSAQINRG